MTLNLEKHLSARAKAVHGSLGKQTSVPIPGLINMGSGTPDFVPPVVVFDAMQEALSSNRVQYTTWTGIPELRKAIAEKLKRDNHVEYDFENELIVTSGAQEALMVTLMTLLDPGDNALIPSPHYDEYTRDSKILGGELIPVATTPESNFTVEIADLEAAMQKLAEAPELGHRRSDVHDPRYRFWAIYSYLIVFLVDTDPLQIIRVVHGSRDLPRVLFKE